MFEFPIDNSPGTVYFNFEMILSIQQPNKHYNPPENDVKTTRSRRYRNSILLSDPFDRLAGALIDRLTHRINLLEILGDSYRFHSSLRKKKDSAIKDND